MKLLRLLIPNGNTKEIQEVESFTVRWYIIHPYSVHHNFQHKVFIKENEAKEFKKRIEESAQLIGAAIKTDLYKN